jgi:hypothetical protein
MKMQNLPAAERFMENVVCDDDDDDGEKGKESLQLTACFDPATKNERKKLWSISAK